MLLRARIAHCTASLWIGCGTAMHARFPRHDFVYSVGATRRRFLERQMKVHGTDAGDDPLIVMQFYYSHTFPYLIEQRRQEIQRRLKDVPEALRQRELVPGLAALGETSGDSAWQVFRDYLDRI
jgi:hypothetical protein